MFLYIKQKSGISVCSFSFFFRACLSIFLVTYFTIQGLHGASVLLPMASYIYIKNCCISWKCLYICYPLVDQHMFASHALHKQQYNDIKVQMLFILVCSSLGKNLKKHSRRGARVIAQLGHLPCMCSTHVRSSASHMVP